MKPNDAEILRRYIQAKQGKQFNLESVAFDKQLNFIRDPARLKALFCTRRAAKSYTAGIYLIYEALLNPGCNCLFVALTIATAEGIIWKDILKDIDRKFNLRINFHESKHTATLPNGSVIYVCGADTDEDEMNKLLGKKYRLVVIDEGSMFSINLHQMIYGVLKPATADQRGTICIMGTSSNITRGLFYDITTGKEPGWSLHTWTAFDNPFVATQWQEELDDIRINRPNFMLTALYKQWYLNQWVIDEDARVYKYNANLNSIAALPVDLCDWTRVLGLDLAHSPDYTAMVVGCYHPLDPTLYLTFSKRYPKMDITDCAHEVKRLDKIYDFQVKVVDGANKMAVAELNNRHEIGLIPADKTGKVDFIRLMNDEFVQGKIKLLPEARKKWSKDDETLEDEYNTLVWETDNGVVKEPKKENPLIHNDQADAALYMWRYCFTYLYKTPEKLPAWESQERWEPEHIKKLADQVKKEQNPNELDLEYDKDLFNFDDEGNI